MIPSAFLVSLLTLLGGPLHSDFNFLCIGRRVIFLLTSFSFSFPPTQIVSFANSRTGFAQTSPQTLILGRESCSTEVKTVSRQIII